MKILIVEDDFASRYGLEKILKTYGECHVTVNGSEAVELFRKAVYKNDIYDLICLDIMLPGLSGQDVLKTMREIEEKAERIGFDERSKIIMITALNDYENIKKAFWNICDGYIVKPLEQENLLKEMRKLKLIK